MNSADNSIKSPENSSGDQRKLLKRKLKRNRIIRFCALGLIILMLFSVNYGLKMADWAKQKPARTICNIMDSSDFYYFCSHNGLYGECQDSKITYNSTYNGQTVIRVETITFPTKIQLTGLGKEPKIDCFFRPDQFESTVSLRYSGIPNRDNWFVLSVFWTVFSAVLIIPLLVFLVDPTCIDI